MLLADRNKRRTLVQVEYPAPTQSAPLKQLSVNLYFAKMSDSYLSSLSRPFDMVVATTQMGINGTMLEYLAGGEIEEQYVCFVWGEQPEGGVAPQLEIKRQDLKADPFSIPHGAVPRKNADLQALVDQGFSCAMV
jgi:hypothetical protein